ncbi:MAG: hypothetical protein ABH828_02745 [archaeon]
MKKGQFKLMLSMSKGLLMLAVVAIIIIFLLGSLIAGLIKDARNRAPGFEENEIIIEKNIDGAQWTEASTRQTIYPNKNYIFKINIENINDLKECILTFDENCVAEDCLIGSEISECGKKKCDEMEIGVVHLGQEEGTESKLRIICKNKLLDVKKERNLTLVYKS